ncbi:MAG: hypothetical protein AB1428_14645 [Bacteroidota bacterium]
MADHSSPPGEVTGGGMARPACAAINALLAALLLVLALVDQISGLPGRQRELAFPLVAVALLVAVAAGLTWRKRWLVVIAAIPLFLGSTLLALTVAAGGWIWGPENAATMNGLIAGGIALAALQIAGIIIAARLHRMKASPDNS